MAPLGSVQVPAEGGVPGVLPLSFRVVGNELNNEKSIQRNTKRVYIYIYYVYIRQVYRYRCIIMHIYAVHTHTHIYIYIYILHACMSLMLD